MVTSGRIPPASGHRGALWWRFEEPRPAVSSASVGGGLLDLSWVLNVGVTHDYARTDLEAHADEVAQAVALRGPGAALFTAVDVARVAHAEETGVQVWSTVGVTRPTWPAVHLTSVPAHPLQVPPPGTINTVVVVPHRLTAAGLVQAALTATEAKAQACVEQGVPGTGTASDAVVVIGAVRGSAEPFGGVRSTWGSRVAVAVHAAVTAGLTAAGAPR